MIVLQDTEGDEVFHQLYTGRLDVLDGSIYIGGTIF